VSDIKVKLKDHSMMFIDCDAGIDQELRDFFSFFVPNYRFHPRFRSKHWDGKIKLYNILRKEMNVGLFSKLKTFAKNRGYTLELEKTSHGYPGQKTELDQNSLIEMIKSLNLPFVPYDYQYESLVHAITTERCVIISPTGSGKSLIIYMYICWILSLIDPQQKKVLLIVPTIGLVTQMYNDFAEYGLNSEKYCHMIFDGSSKTTKKKIVISTWQSIYKMPPKWFTQFGCVVGDEVHGFKAKSLSAIMNKSKDVRYRLGTTGTLEDTQCHRLTIEGLFGPVKQFTTTKKLQNEGRLANLDIDIVQINYKEKPKLDKSSTYTQEVDWIMANEKRNNFIKNLALDAKGNTLVLFRFVGKHGEKLFDIISKERENVYFISGGTAKEDREAVRAIVEKQKNAIIIASLGTFSTGINIKNIHNIIFTSPSKSLYKVLQSIGRGLRLADNGQTTTLYDLVDDLTKWTQRVNYALEHSADRIKMYIAEQHEFKIHKVDL
jgi:superfamily II DNA or RNA helicase